MAVGGRFDLEEARREALEAKRRAKIRSIVSNATLVAVLLAVGEGSSPSDYLAAGLDLVQALWSRKPLLDVRSDQRKPAALGLVVHVHDKRKALGVEILDKAPERIAVGIARVRDDVRHRIAAQHLKEVGGAAPLRMGGEPSPPVLVHRKLHGVLEAVRLDAVLEIGLDLVLVARVGMDNVPTLRHASPSVP